MEKDKGKVPEALPDESLDEAAGGLLPAVKTGAASFPGFTGYVGGVRVASADVTTDGTALKIADGSVKPGA